MPERPLISYRREFAFAVAPQQVWDAIEHVEEFEGWWSWLEDFRLDGGALRPGASMYGVVAPPLPYRMRVQVDLTRCDPPERIDADVHGDLEGSARLDVRPSGLGSRVEVAWTIEMMQRPMRIASRLAHPVLRWGHDRVVDMTVAGFRRHVEKAALAEPGNNQADGGQDHTPRHRL